MGSPSKARRNGRLSMSGATKAPAPWRVTTRPCARNAATAPSRTTVRLDAHGRDHFLLGRQFGAGGEFGAGDLASDALGDLAGQAAMRRDRRQYRAGLARPGHGFCGSTLVRLSYKYLLSRSGRAVNQSAPSGKRRGRCKDAICWRWPVPRQRALPPDGARRRRTRWS